MQSDLYKETGIEFARFFVVKIEFIIFGKH